MTALDDAALGHELPSPRHYRVRGRRKHPMEQAGPVVLAVVVMTLLWWGLATLLHLARGGWLSGFGFAVIMVGFFLLTDLRAGRRGGSTVYEVADGRLTVTGRSGAAGRVVIPVADIADLRLRDRGPWLRRDVDALAPVLVVAVRRGAGVRTRELAPIALWDRGRRHQVERELRVAVGLDGGPWPGSATPRAGAR